MAFDPTRLLVQLQNTGLQNKDNPLYQLLRQLINTAAGLSTSVFGPPSGSSSGGGLSNKTYLTVDDETGSLPNSRRHLAGPHIAFDDSLPGQRTVRSSEWGVLVDGDPLAGTEPFHSLLTNGNTINPELVFDSSGDVIVTETRVPAPGIVFDSNDEVVMVETL